MKTDFSKPDFFDLTDGTDSVSLLTRDQGRALMTEVLARLEEHETVTLDLSRAQTLSPSFADELFAGLDSALGADFSRRVRISGARPEWQHLIKSALHHRRNQAPAPAISKSPDKVSKP